LFKAVKTDAGFWMLDSGNTAGSFVHYVHSNCLIGILHCQNQEPGIQLKLKMPPGVVTEEAF
jgi:hypothetical protein